MRSQVLVSHGPLETLVVPSRAEELLALDSTSQTETDPFVGQCIEQKYEILERVNAGGMGAIYRARHRLINRIVAIKLLHRMVGDPEQEEQFSLRFYREARTASQIDHPHAIRIYDFGLWNDRPYLVMQFIEGKTLDQLIEDEGRISVDRCRELLRQIGGAISAAHAQGIVHRDLKPENIIVSPGSGGSDFVTVVDFGIARTQSEEGCSGDTVTQEGRIIGTPQYMAPEQIVGGTVERRSDIYALGILTFEMLSGEPPFVADSMMQLIFMQAHHAPPALLSRFTEQADQALARFDPVLQRALAKLPSERFSTVEEFLTAFDDVAVGTGYSPDAAAKAHVHKIKLRAGAFRPIALICLSLLVIFGLTLLMPALAKRQVVAPAQSRHQPDSPLQREVAAQRELPDTVPGIGLEIRRKNGGFSVLLVVPGSPAAKAGFQEGDMIVAVNDQELRAKEEDEVFQLLRGPVDSSVRIVLLRNEERRGFELVREAIPLPFVELSKRKAENLWNQGAVEEAVAVLEDLAARNPENARAQAHLGVFYERVGRFDEALRQFESALKRQADLDFAVVHLSNVLLRLGRIQEAKEMYKRALSQDPDNADLTYNLGLILSQVGEVDAAVESFKKAIASDPHRAVLHYSLGLALAQTGKIQDAIAAYEQARTLNPKESKFLGVLGLTYTGLKEYLKAEPFLTAAVAARPNFSPYHFALAKVYRELGRSSEASAQEEIAHRLEGGVTGDKL